MWGKLWQILKKLHPMHVFAMALCISATFYTMIQLSSDPIFKVYAGAGSIFAGLFTQFLRGWAAAFRERGKREGRPSDWWKAAGCWFIIIIYIVVFEFISVFGVVVSKVGVEEQINNQVISSQDNLKTDLDDIKNDIKTKKEERKQEFSNRGRGPKYDRYEDEIKELEKAKRKLESKLSKASNTSRTVAKSVFEDLHDVTMIEAKWFKISMSTAFLLLVFVAALLFPVPVQLREVVISASANKTKVLSGPQKALSNDPIQKIKELLEFTEALFNDFTKKLNSVSMISQKTGISLDRCEEYWNYLLDLTIDGIPVINKRQGGCSCNFTKDELLQFLKSNYSQGFLDTLTGIG